MFSGKNKNKQVDQIISQNIIDRNSKNGDVIIPHGELNRGLSNRQLQLIAIGGTIGTSLFLGAQKSISIAGPSIFFAYLIAGIVVFFAMRVLGELILSNLKFRSLRDVATHYFGHLGGFLVGWMYWAFWIVTGMQDSVAVSVYLEDYFPHIPKWLPGLTVVLIIFILNTMAVHVFGELEFWLAIIKIVAICALIVVGVFMLFSGAKYIYDITDLQGNVTSITANSSISNFWTNSGGILPHGLFGFFLGFQMAFLAYTGVETIGTTVAEVKNPELVIPKAINSIPLRISIFYVGGIFVIICALPWDIISKLHGSPFVSIFDAIGVPAVGVIMTFVLITAAVSGANSGMYATSRMMFGLSIDGHAPSLFSKVSKKKVPFNAMLFCLFIIGVPVVLTSVLFSDPMSAFTIFAVWATGCNLTVWLIILLSYFKYRNKHEELHNKTKFKVPFGKVSASLVFVFFAFVIFMMLFDSILRIGIILSLFTLLSLSLIFYFKVRKIEHVEEVEL